MHGDEKRMSCLCFCIVSKCNPSGFFILKNLHFWLVSIFAHGSVRSFWLFVFFLCHSHSSPISVLVRKSAMVRSHPRLLPSTDQWAEGVTGEGAEANSTLLFFFLQNLFLFRVFLCQEVGPAGRGRTGRDQHWWHRAHRKIFLIVVFSFLIIGDERQGTFPVIFCSFYCLCFFFLLSLQLKWRSHDGHTRVWPPPD